MSLTTSSNEPVSGAAPLLQISGLRTQIAGRRRVVRAVDGVDLAVRAGETVGLVGESGSGKTMTALSVVRLLPTGGSITDGQVMFEGRDLVRADKAELCRVRGGQIGFIFQDPMTSLNPTMTVGRQIAEVVREHNGGSWRAALRRSAEVLGLVGVPSPAERVDQYPHELSGGLRQRVMIAVALACEPRLLIADEPTTALDVTVQDQILSLLADLAGRLHMGLLLVTHDLGVIAQRADRVAVMYAGRIVESADTETLFRQMRHPYTEALLQATPTRRTDRRSALYSIPGLPPDLAHPLQGCRFAVRCRFATQQCRDTEPVLAGANGHEFACYHPRPAHKPALAHGGEPASGPVSARAALVQIRNVVREFPVRSGLLGGTRRSVKAVSGVTLDIREGETLGLVGESGCGKTTLGRMIVALEQPDSGSLVVGGQPLAELSAGQLRRFRRDLQMVFQDPYASLDPTMTVSALVDEPLRIQRVGDHTKRKERVRHLIDVVGLPSTALRRYPHEFSGGQRQRIGLARALALNPRLLVADEPVSALDMSVQAQILNLMSDLRAEFDLTYLFISHDLSVIRYIADQVAVMYLGKLVEIGPAADVFEAPAHPYTRGLLEAVPEPDPSAADFTHGPAGRAVAGELPSPVDPPSGCRFRTRCPLAQPICEHEEPKLRGFGRDHDAACHFPLISPLADVS
jgi:oligopeptide/dipeptide ABC transporter ATP-binding protein